MKYTREQALEVAIRNAIKAISEGYTAEQDAIDPTRWTVRKPTGAEYTVHLHINPTDRTEYCVFCDCPFSGDGFENWTCKHGEICREIADATYYRETDEIIRETLRASLRQDSDLYVTATGRAYPMRRAGLYTSFDPENPEEEFPTIAPLPARSNPFGDPAIAKAYAADADLWETHLRA